MTEYEKAKQIDQRLHAGVSYQQLQKEMGMSYYRIKKLLKHHGFALIDPTVHRTMLDSAQLTKAVEMLKKGMFYGQVAEQLGVNIATLRRAMKLRGIDIDPGKYRDVLSKEQLEIVKGLLKNGMSYPMVAKKLNIKRHAISRYIRGGTIKPDFRPTPERIAILNNLLAQKKTKTQIARALSTRETFVTMLIVSQGAILACNDMPNLCNDRNGLTPVHINAAAWARLTGKSAVEVARQLETSIPTLSRIFDCIEEHYRKKLVDGEAKLEEGQAA